MLLNCSSDWFLVCQKSKREGGIRLRFFSFFKNILYEKNLILLALQYVIVNYILPIELLIDLL